MVAASFKESVECFLFEKVKLHCRRKVCKAVSFGALFCDNAEIFVKFKGSDRIIEKSFVFEFFKILVHNFFNVVIESGTFGENLHISAVSFKIHFNYASAAADGNSVGKIDISVIDIAFFASFVEIFALKGFYVFFKRGKFFPIVFHFDF